MRFLRNRSWEDVVIPGVLLTLGGVCVVMGLTTGFAPFHLLALAYLGASVWALWILEWF